MLLSYSAMILWVLDIVVHTSYSEAVQGTTFLRVALFVVYRETKRMFLQKIVNNLLGGIACNEK